MAAGTDGPYAMALAEAIRQPGLDIFHLFNQVGLKVKRDTQGSQQPWVSSSPIDGDFYLRAQRGRTGRSWRAPTLEAPASVQAGASRDAAGARQAGSRRRQPIRIRPRATLAEKGQPQAQIDLGLLLREGLSASTKDYAAALQWFQRAAGQRFAARPVLPRPDVRAWLRRAAQLRHGAGLVSARGGKELSPGRDRGGAVLWHAASACERDLAQRNDLAAARAGQDSPQAQFILGNIYRRGLGRAAGPADSRAMVSARGAAGFRAGARLQLGLMYEHGNGVPQDDAQAMQLLRHAAEKGNALAQNALGMMYRARLRA